jgi:hypothetical protein
MDLEDLQKVKEGLFQTFGDIEKAETNFFIFEPDPESKSPQKTYFVLCLNKKPDATYLHISTITNLTDASLLYGGRLDWMTQSYVFPNTKQKNISIRDIKKLLEEHFQKDDPELDKYLRASSDAGKTIESHISYQHSRNYILRKLNPDNNWSRLCHFLNICSADPNNPLHGFNFRLFCSGSHDKTTFQYKGPNPAEALLKEAEFLGFGLGKGSEFPAPPSFNKQSTSYLVRQDPAWSFPTFEVHVGEWSCMPSGDMQEKWGLWND